MAPRLDGTSKEGLRLAGLEQTGGSSGGQRQPAHHIPFLLSDADPLLNRRRHGKNASLHGLHALGCNHNATLNDQGEEALKAGQEGDKRVAFACFATP